MNFTNNELFLISVLLILCVIIGALIHLTYLQRKDLKRISIDYKNTMSFIDKVFNNIAVRECIDIKKYIDMTQTQLNNAKKGGEK